MTRPSRLPRRVRLGRGYYLTVVLANQTTLCELAEADDGEYLDGVWDVKLGSANGYAGTIYIHNQLKSEQRWAVYWHELIHAINDIMAWDNKQPIIL